MSCEIKISLKGTNEVQTIIRNLVKKQKRDEKRIEELKDSIDVLIKDIPETKDYFPSWIVNWKR